MQKLKWHGMTTLIVILSAFVFIRFQAASAETAVARYTIEPGVNGVTTIFVSPRGPLSNTVTLPDIHAAVQALTTTVLLENQGGGVWLLNANLTISRFMTLSLTSDTVTWLKLRSNPSATPVTDTIDYDSFAALRVLSSQVLISGTRITSWDTTANTFDTDVKNGRSYVVARDAARMDIVQSDLSYLGSNDSASYGVSWRDGSTSSVPPLTRVTGSAINSVFSYNYYGVFTFQAADMVFRGNQFHHNISYGFDPHDFSHDFLVEDNAAFENGNHGFIVSRGCYNFVFRRNLSYNNRVVDATKNAQGFMLDPGSDSPTSPASPSYNIVLENNQAWGNSGYGLRIVDSYSNVVQGNVFTNNSKGISVEGVNSYSNTLRANTLVSNTTDGIVLTDIAPRNLITGNLISTNGTYGVYLKDARDNQVRDNVIISNSLYGIRASGLPTITVGNSWSGNTIYSNTLGGISVPDNSNGGVQPPVLLGGAPAIPITGTAAPGARIELFSDAAGQGQFLQGQTTADANGLFSFSMARGQAGAITAIATDVAGNSSAFSKPLRYNPILVQYAIRPGVNGATTIFVSRVGFAGGTVALPDVQAGVQALTTTALLENQGNGAWLLNANLTLNSGLTLSLTSESVTWLKLRSNASNVAGVLGADGVDVVSDPSQAEAAALAPYAANYDYASFASLRALDSTLLISRTRITSWDTAANTYDTDLSNGRSYVIALSTARMDIAQSDLSYLGSADSDSYGVTWRDFNPTSTPLPLQTRVMGRAISSTFSYNYYGLYASQAADLVIRDNQLHHNATQGFDLHNASRGVVVQNNAAFENGNHGFVISSGTYNTLLENNQAWGNAGYGLRIVSSTNNLVQTNVFTGNLRGISVEEAGSLSNTLLLNTIISNTTDGIALMDGASNTIITGNAISANGGYGVYLKDTRGNKILNNVIAGNTLFGIRASGLPTLTVGNTWAGNAIYNNTAGGISLPDNANGAVQAPILSAGASGLPITGTAAAGARIELFVDAAGQGRYPQGQTVANANGLFSFNTLPARTSGQTGVITAIATDTAGNSSAFSRPLQQRYVAYLPLIAAQAAQ